MYSHRILSMVVAALILLLGACARLPRSGHDAAIQREAMRGTNLPPPAPLPLDNNPSAVGTVSASRIIRGKGRFVRVIHPPGQSKKSSKVVGAITFNFENQPVQAVVKTILGDLLKKNYTIVPGVHGSISFSTSEPVAPSQALPILGTLLSWTDNALVRRKNSYIVMPEKDAVAGNLVPTLGVPAPQNGLQARLFLLHYISASEMQKLLKPFARADAILVVDSARNMLVLDGTPEELNNYGRTIRTFDVDWLRGMSVGLFNLEHVSAKDIVPQLEKIFGTTQSLSSSGPFPRGIPQRYVSSREGEGASGLKTARVGTPLAGMLRFIPIQRANTLVVISTQPAYVDEVGRWITKIDKGGDNQPQLYVYNVRNIKAAELAKYLAQIYTRNAGPVDNGGRVGPYLPSSSMGSMPYGDASGMGSNGGSFGSFGSGVNGGFGMGSNLAGMNMGRNNNQDRQYTSTDGNTRISSVSSSNQLLVRTRPSQWREIREAIAKLDNVPLQVQIETRILEVKLNGKFEFGVQWYLQGLTGSHGKPGSSNFSPGQPYRHRQVAIGEGGNTFHGSPLFYSFLNSKMQVAVRAMESSGNTKTLSAPSLVVMNNQPAQIVVGDRIPVVQNYYNPGGGEINTVGNVEYQNTGVILKVRPRVNPGGLVYLSVQQQVSSPGLQDKNGNYTISERSMQTEVAVQSGQTVLLGGLIQQDEGSNDMGIPILKDIPLLGRLFGSTGGHRNRTELIVLITPRVIRNSSEARQIVQEYQRAFESLKPLRVERAKKAAKKAAKSKVKKDVTNKPLTPYPSAKVLSSWGLGRRPG